MMLEEDTDRIRARVEASGASSRMAKRLTQESWSRIASRVYLRDDGVCHPCGFLTTVEFYECGHIIDRCAGGSDRDANLVVMCSGVQ